MATPDMGQIEMQAEKGMGPVDTLRLKLLGPRANGASAVKAFFYLSLASIALAINSQCSSREWAKYAKENYRPNYIYLDPTGAAYLVEMPRETTPVVSEDSVRFWIWTLTKYQYEVRGDTAGEESKALVDYFFTGDALKALGRSADDPNILGSSAEKAQLISMGRFRDLEMRSLFLRDFTQLSDGAQQISAEIMFYARTYTRGMSEPELRRAFRVRYEFTVMSPLPPGKKLREQRDFLKENPIRIRVKSFHLEEENPGTPIPAVPENQGPNPGPQARALEPNGALPIVPIAAVGGPAAPLATPTILAPKANPTSTLPEPRR